MKGSSREESGIEMDTRLRTHYPPVCGWKCLLGGDSDNQTTSVRSIVRWALKQHDGFAPGRFCDWTRIHERCFLMASVTFLIA
jgi:hypothetical protein